MKIVFFVAVIAATSFVTSARDSVTVDPGGGGSNIDWSKTDLLTVYCVAPGKECPGGDIAGQMKFAATSRQCQTYCSVNLECLSASFATNKDCQLKSKRCTAEQLIDSTGTDLYRLKKGEKCPADRPEYVRSTIKYSNTFCMMRGKACPGHDLYRKPQNIYPLEACLAKCAKITSCSMVDFKNNKCSPKDYACTDAELMDDPDMYNAQRLVEGVEGCAPNRGLRCPDNSQAVGMECVCDAGFTMKSGKCIQVCPANSQAQGGTCVCDEGLEMVNGACKPTECPKYAHRVAGQCKCIWQTYADGTCGDRYCHRPWLDCTGRDIRFMNIVTIDDCKKACDQEERCKSIQVRPERRECWLKLYRCTNSELSVVEDANDFARMADGEECAPNFLPKQKYCPRKHLTCPGNDIRGKTSADEARCKYLCTMHPECKSIQWGVNNDCWIKRKVCTNDQLQARVEGHDFVKVGLTDDCSQFGKPTSDYCVRKNMNCPGDDIIHLQRVSTLSQCQYYCDYDADCESIQWREDGNCWVKRKVCSQHDLKFVDKAFDAVKVAVGTTCDSFIAKKNEYCIREGKNCAGHDIVSYTGVKDQAECLRLCDYKDECLSIHYRPSDKKCWLKRFKCLDHQVVNLDGNTDAYKGPCDEKVTYAYCRREQMDCPGNDIKKLRGVDEQKCREQCDLVPECASLRFKGTDCWLKRKACSNAELKHGNDGVDMVRIESATGSCADYMRPDFGYCTRPMFGCPGHDILRLDHIESLEICQQHCDFKTDCKSLDWDSKSKQCWLKRDFCARDKMDFIPTRLDSVRVERGTPCDEYIRPVHDYCTRNGLECAGSDIAHKHPVESLADCQYWCDFEPECLAIHYREDKNCWIKRKRCEKRELNERTNGYDSYKEPCIVEPEYAYCRREHLDCTGEDIRHMGGRTEEQCKELCDMYPECKSIQYRTDGNCWIKRRVCTNAQLTPRIIGVDLIRVAKGESCAPYDPPAAQFCVRNHHYCSGGDIHHRGGVPSNEMCELWCQYFPDCVSYHYKQDKNCWIERYLCTNDQLVPELVSFDAVKVGPNESCEKYSQPPNVYCTRPLMHCPGHDILHRGGVTSIEQCQYLCDYKSDCQSIHYRSDGNCWLKRYVCPRNSLVYDSTGFDSVKVAQAGRCEEYLAPETEYCTRDKQVCSGNDIEHRHPVETLQDCQYICNLKPDCLSIFWKPDRNCWIKRKRCELRELSAESAGSDSYKAPCIGKVDYDYCRRENLECPGSDIKHQGGMTEDKCKELCDMYPDCLSLHFRGTDCWIKRKLCTNNELTPRLNALDLVRVAKGGSCDAYDQPKFQYCTRRLFECPGDDIVHIGGVGSIEQCQYWCDHKTDCKSIHYRKDGNCWLKRKFCARDQLYLNVNGFDSVRIAMGESCEPYLRPVHQYCTRNSKECQPFNLEHRHPVESLTDCQYWCDFKPQCKSIHYRDDKNCWLKSDRCEKRELIDRPSSYHDSYKAPCIVELEYDYCRREHLDCTGDDIRHMGGRTEAQCKELCDMYPECQSIQYRTDGNCWIKRRVCTNAQLTPRIIGVDLIRVAKGASCDAYKAPEKKYCLRDHHCCIGGDIHHRGGVPNKEMCEQWCQYTPTCVSYHYKEDKNCWLERYLCTNNELYPELISADRVKVDIGESCAPYEPKYKYCTRNLSECPGADIVHRGGIPDQETCEYLCNFKTDCQSIHYRRDGNCWLKRHVCSRDGGLTYNVYGIDAVRVDLGESCAPYERPIYEYCIRENKECAGEDIGHRHPVETMDDCQLWCDFTPTCKAYHYRADKNCWIKRRTCPVSQLTTRIGAFQNYKKVAGETCA